MTVRSRKQSLQKGLLALTLLFSGVAPTLLSPSEAESSSKQTSTTLLVKAVSKKVAQKSAQTPKGSHLQILPNQGIATVSFPKMKKGYKAFIVIEKGKQEYNFRMTKTENIPLPFGSGIYDLTLYQGKGDDFIPMETKRFYASFSNLQLAKQKTILSPGIQDKQVDHLLKTKFKNWRSWTPDMRVAKVHQYVTRSFSYDYELAENLEPWYLPDTKRLVQQQEGICYDFASLTSSLLREMNVPTRVVMGYPKDFDVYHSWNEVYVKRSWKVVDTTFDLGKNTRTPYKFSTNYPKADYRF